MRQLRGDIARTLQRSRHRQLQLHCPWNQPMHLLHELLLLLLRLHMSGALLCWVLGSCLCSCRASSCLGSYSCSLKLLGPCIHPGLPGLGIAHSDAAHGSTPLLANHPASHCAS